MAGLLERVYRFFMPGTRDVDSIVAKLTAIAGELEAYSAVKLLEHDNLYDQVLAAEREYTRAGRVAAALHNLCK